MIIQQSLKVCWNNLVFNKTHHKTWFWSLFLNGGVSPQEKHHKRGMTKRWYVRTMRRFALICKDQNCPPSAIWRVARCVFGLQRPPLTRLSSPLSTLLCSSFSFRVPVVEREWSVFLHHHVIMAQILRTKKSARGQMANNSSLTTSLV